MKKAISMILAMAMLLSFTACGGASFIGEKVSVTIQGENKSKLTIKLKDTFEEEMKLEADFPKEGGSSIIFEGTLKESKEHENIYELVSTTPGIANITFNYIDSRNNVQTIVTMDIEVTENLTFAYANVSIQKINNLQPFLPELEGAMITDGDGSYKIITVSNSNGYWKKGEYDEKVIKVEGPEISEDDKESAFLIEAQKPGKTLLSLICEKARLQMMLSFEVTETSAAAVTADQNQQAAAGAEEADTNETTLSLKLLDSYTEEYIPKTSEEDKKIIEAAGEALEILRIPDDIYIEDVIFSKLAEDKKGKEITYQTKEGKKFEISYNPAEKIDDGNTMEMVFTVDEVLMDYKATILESKELYTEEILQAGEPKECATMKGGGVEAEYFYMPEGYAVAVWQSGKTGNRLTFMNDNKASNQYKEVLQMLLDSQALSVKNSEKNNN